ncbi:hypothetical protein [Bradyrhizobium prioriisuperbiae]|uniref:hypothetical protein n=1 Tax=Bradyrhizobium prioriisuperbiae TaxID=2854389 RepID=UPI0028E6B32A|nr:hypothetical protein [Bradyrhizobium prioritasuperba]
MPAIAEIMSSSSPRPASNTPAPRGRDLPTCAVCSDSMIAAEASAFLSEDTVSYLWTCETCGYGFVTKHALSQFVCN